MTIKKRGFTMAEIMVGMGLMGIISLGTMHLMQSTNKTQRDAIFDNNANTLLREMDYLMKKPENCEATFIGKNLSAVAPDVFTTLGSAGNPIIKYYHAGSIVADANNRYKWGEIIGGDKGGENSIKIAGARMRSWNPYSETASQSLTLTEGVLTVEVYFKKVNQTKNGKPTSYGGRRLIGGSIVDKALSFTVGVIIDKTSGIVMKCKTFSLEAEAGCKALGGTIAPTGSFNAGQCQHQRICLNNECHTRWTGYKVDEATCVLRVSTCLTGEVLHGIGGPTADKVRCCRVILGGKEWNDI